MKIKSFQRVVAAGLVAAWLVSLLLVAPPRPGESQAYIGPGAGIALAGGLGAVLMAMVSAVGLALIMPIRMLWRLIRGQRGYRHAKVKRVVVIGLDGLEPTLADEFLREGALPNLQKLRQRGGYLRLGTTWPPLSPVAWSSFTTGSNPGKHNIFDFIARTPNYIPTISSVRIRESARPVKLGPFSFTRHKTDITAMRKSKPFWTVLGENGVFSSIIRVPITFPPDKFKGVQLSAMCVPDLRGSQGMFSHFIEVGDTGQTMDGDVGGDRLRVERDGATIKSFVRGPTNPAKKGEELRVPFTVSQPRANSYVMKIDGQEVALQVGKYTDWVVLTFRGEGGVKINGVCRFFLKRFEKPFELYATPLQIDPDKPVMPISHPFVYSSYLARAQGPFSTLGLAEDTWSLSEKVLSEDAFLEQAYDIHEEREKMFFDALDKTRRGVVVCVFDGPDRIQHMFWRFIDDKHPAVNDEFRKQHRHVIREMYQRMDKLVGRAVDKAGPDTAVFVMSDHGFKTFRRGVDLNAWLRDNGYLKLKGGKRVAEASYLHDIDWAQTRAYAVGLAGIYLNIKGREQHGVVEPSAAVGLINEICSKLTGLIDPDNGEVGVKEAVHRGKVYKGPYTENAPDIIVGYNVGYRVSWDAAIGKCGEPVFSNNVKAWSGDHCVHPALVPGVLFSSIQLNHAEPNIVDMAPTILDLFGFEKPDYMDGKSLLPSGGVKSQAAPVGAAQQPA